MLHRSFKPAKCKTALKLATSRLKLMKNKKEVQFQQLKRDLAKLLESGQDQTARIRVEHVVREEKTMAAYELLEIYCELIAARLPIIESQKNCPIDLKEAITSVVFASPRCSDIPELQEIHKHFTAKYGKEFISAAVELRPECGVSRMLVEKLSAKAPDGPTKIKILSAIAEEHNIKWDPKSFGEKELKPPNDLLNGPSTFEMASRVQAERPIVQPPPSNAQAQAQAPPRPEQKHDAPINFEHNARSSTSFENFASTDGGGAHATMPAPYHPVERPSETRSEKTEVRHSYSGDVNSFSSDRKHWNMEFKDATAAAQAAAEAAERASMAARAAADLSSRANISRQHSTESQKSNIYSARDEGPTKNVASKLPTEQFAKDPRHNFQDRNPRMQTGQVDSEHDHPDIAAEKFYRDSHGNTKKSSRSGSLRSSRASIDDDKLINDFQKGDRYSHKSSFEEEAIKMENSSGFSGVAMKKQSIGSEVEFGSSGQGGLQSDNFNYFAEEIIRKQTSSVSSHSHSSSRGDDYDVSPSSYQKFRTLGGEDPFVGVDQGNNHRDTVRTSSFSNDAVVFDDPVSDDDAEIRYDSPKYDREESKFYTTSPGRESPSHLSSNTDTWSPRQNMSGSNEKFSSVSRVSAEWHSPPNFDESSTKSAHPPQPDEFLPVTFDESESLSSETEDELDKSRLHGKTDPSSLHRKENIFSTSPDHVQHESQGSTGFFHTQKGDSRSNRNQDLNYSSDDEELVDVSANNNRGTEFSVQSQRKFGFDDVPARQSSGKLAKSQKSSNDMASEPFYDQVEERNSYLSPQTSRFSLVNEVKATNDSYTPELSGYMKDDELFQQSSLESGNELKFGPLIGGLRNKGYIRPPYTKSSSGDVSSSKKAAEDSVTAIEHSPVSPAVEGSSLKSAVSTNVENKSSSRTPITDYDSDTDESEEELPQRNSRSKREPHSPKASKGVTATSRFRAPVTFFDSDDNDSEEDLPKQTSNSAGRAGTGYSRRTKATPSSGTSSYSKTAVGSEASVSSDVDAKKTPSRSSYRSENPPNPWSQTETSAHWGSPPEPREEKQSTSRPMPESNISRVSYRSDTPPNPQSRTASSGQWGSPPEPRAEKQPTSRPTPESNMSMRKEERKSSVIEQPSNPRANLKSSEKQSTSKPMPESNISVRKERLKSSAVEQSSSARENLKSSAKQATSKPTPESDITMRKENSRFSAPEQRSSSPLTTVKSASTESPMSSTSGGEAPSRESSLKKATHVHPKLPDYDTIAAQLQSLRANR